MRWCQLLTLAFLTTCLCDVTYVLGYTASVAVSASLLPVLSLWTSPSMSMRTDLKILTFWFRCFVVVCQLLTYFIWHEIKQYEDDCRYAMSFFHRVFVSSCCGIVSAMSGRATLLRARWMFSAVLLSKKSVPESASSKSHATYLRDLPQSLTGSVS